MDSLGSYSCLALSIVSGGCREGCPYGLTRKLETSLRFCLSGSAERVQGVSWVPSVNELRYSTGAALWFGGPAERITPQPPGACGVTEMFAGQGEPLKLADVACVVEPNADPLLVLGGLSAPDTVTVHMQVADIPEPLARDATLGLAGRERVRSSGGLCTACIGCLGGRGWIASVGDRACSTDVRPQAGRGCWGQGRALRQCDWADQRLLEGVEPRSPRQAFPAPRLPATDPDGQQQP